MAGSTVDADWAPDSQSYGLECPHVTQELDVPVMTGEAQRYGDGGQDEWDVDLGGDMIAFCDVFKEWQKSSNGVQMHDGSGQMVVDFTTIGRPSGVHGARWSEKIREAGLSQDPRNSEEKETTGTKQRPKRKGKRKEKGTTLKTQPKAARRVLFHCCDGDPKYGKKWQ